MYEKEGFQKFGKNWQWHSKDCMMQKSLRKIF
jgi:hypothetical protein